MGGMTVGTAYASAAQSLGIVGMPRRKLSALYEQHLDAEQHHRHQYQEYGYKNCFHRS